MLLSCVAGGCGSLLFVVCFVRFADCCLSLLTLCRRCSSLCCCSVVFDVHSSFVVVVFVGRGGSLLVGGCFVLIVVCR